MQTIAALQFQSAISSKMKTGRFFGELKRRSVYRVAIAYAFAGWALAQGIAQVLPVFDAPTWVVRAMMVVIALGFPIVLVLAWLFDITSEGIKRTADISPDEPPDILRQAEAQARQQFVRGYLCALIYAGLGDKTEAIHYLKREYLNHNNTDTTGLPIDSMLDMLCDAPQFETLANLTPELTRIGRRAEAIEPANTDTAGTKRLDLISEDLAEVKPDLPLHEDNGEIHNGLQPVNATC
jgi:hypothetical protein